MLMTSGRIAGVVLAQLAPNHDERGWFLRVFDEDAFAAAGLCTTYPHHGEARNERRGTLRGLHYQRAPHGEAKVIRCVSGAVYDVVVDARRDSPTYGLWEAFELRADAPCALYVPVGCAHGYQTLADETLVHYLLSVRYVPEAATGFRFDSPALGIPWPISERIVSPRDAALPPFGA